MTGLVWIPRKVLGGADLWSKALSCSVGPALTFSFNIYFLKFIWLHRVLVWHSGFLVVIFGI